MNIATPKAARRDQGFSFIELLAYIAIAALLILAALPQFSNYRERASIVNLQSDLRNAAAAMESAQIDDQTYPTTLPGDVRLSRGSQVTVAAASRASFCLEGSSAVVRGKWSYGPASGLVKGACVVEAAAPSFAGSLCSTPEMQAFAGALRAYYRSADWQAIIDANVAYAAASSADRSAAGQVLSKAATTPNAQPVLTAAKAVPVDQYTAGWLNSRVTSMGVGGSMKSKYSSPVAGATTESLNASYQSDLTKLDADIVKACNNPVGTPA